MRVIVVGAGVIGSAIAYRLVRCGAEVTVVDPKPGHGASRAAAGMLTPVGEAWHGEDALLGLLTYSARRYPSFIADLERVTDLPNGFRRTQTMICGVDSADIATLQRLNEVVRAAGLTSRELTAREARRLEPGLTPRLSGAFLAPDDHQIDPRLLCAALLDAVVRSGGEVVEQPATKLRPDGVELADGSALNADTVVVANGVDSSTLADELNCVRPVYGDIVRLEPARFGPELVTGVVRGVVGGRNVYLVPREDGSIVLGATMREDGDERVSAGGVHQLLRDAAMLAPGVLDLSISEVLARARPATPDNLPLLGRLASNNERMSENVIAATGFGRNGVLLAPLAADVVAHRLGVDAGSAEGSMQSSAADVIATALRHCDPARFTSSTDVVRESTALSTPAQTAPKE